MAQRAAAPPGSATIRNTCQSALWERSDCPVSDEHDAMHMISNDWKTRSPTRRGASESDAKPPASASMERPAAKAFVRVGEANGSTPTSLMRLAYQAAMPAMSPP